MTGELKTTPAKAAKQAGLKSLLQLSQICGESTQTLGNWFHNKPFVFAAVLEKAAREIKEQYHERD